MFKTFKEYVNQKSTMNEGTPTNFVPQNQIGFDYKRSALEKIIRANNDGKMPFEIEYLPSALRIELGLTDEESNFLKKFGIIQNINGKTILNQNNFSNIYRQMTNRNPVL